MFFTKYYSYDQSKEDKVDRECATYGREAKWVEVLSGETWRKAMTSMIMRRREGIIKICLKEVGWEGMDSIYLAEDMDN